MAALATIAPFGFSFDPVRLLTAYRSLGCTACQFYRSEENPPSAAEALRPHAVDICSRVESAPGIKDIELLERLFEEVRNVQSSSTDPS